MIIYYAGVQNNKRDLYSIVKNGGSHLMLSYHYDKKTSDNQFVRFRKYGLHIMLDSGAYSAWKLGVKIDLDHYMKFIDEKRISKYISVDVVGDPEKSYINLKYMEKKGYNPIPVFHMGSDVTYLDQLVKEEYYTIALGGSVGKSRQERRKFFKLCFEKYPNIFYHGLGMTDVELMKEFPWFSVDSTTWLIGIKNRQLITDQGRITLSEEFSQEERTGLNIKYFSELEMSINKKLCVL
jgi:hypothetical protein